MDHASDPRALFDVRREGRVLRVVVRRTPYADQGLLVPLEHRPQTADAASLLVAFACLRALEPAYTGTFNVGGQTHDRLHAQSFKGSAPFWDHLATGAIGSGPGERIARGAWRADVSARPCRCALFGSAEPASLAPILAERTRELTERARRTTSTSVGPGRAAGPAVPPLRRRGNEIHLYATERLGSCLSAITMRSGDSRGGRRSWLAGTTTR